MGAQYKMVERGNPDKSEDNTQKYRNSKGKVKELFKDAKDKEWEKFGEDLELDRNATKKKKDSTGNLVAEK